MQAKSRLYGRRIRGDIGPLNIDPASRLPGRILGPAVSLDGVYQDYDEMSLIKHFTYGSRMVVDERVFHYARAGNALNCGLGAHIGGAQDVAFAVVTVDLLAAGKYTFEVTIAGTDGRLGTGVIAEDELAEGNAIIFPDGMGDTINRRIVHNTAVDPPVVLMTVTVDRPLPVALTPAPHAELIANRYLDVLEGNLDRQMIVGMPPIAATVGQYLWLQTWGLVWITPVLGDWTTIDSSLAMFRGNGSIAAFNEADPAIGIQQIAGTIVAPGFGGGQGAPFVNLMIAP